MHHDAFVLMNSATSHCFVSYVFPNTFGLKLNKGNNNFILGNQVPRVGILKSMFNITIK